MIRYHMHLAPRAVKTLVILPGRTEPGLKYAELAYDLQSPDLNVFILNHQGQGGSERLLRDTDKGHVLHHRDYVNDFTQFMDEVVLPLTKDTAHYLLAHSMGGSIAIPYLHAHHGVFKRAVLSAPMLQMNTDPYQEAVALLLSQALFLAGKGTDYAPDRGPYRPETDVFETNIVTHSKVRFETNKSLFLNDPSLIVGGPTVRWVLENLKASRRLVSMARSIQTPLLILQAGQDKLVVNPRQNKFCSKAPQCSLMLLQQAHHEILAEQDAIRDPAMARVKSFLGF